MPRSGAGASAVKSVVPKTGEMAIHQSRVVFIGQVLTRDRAKDRGGDFHNADALHRAFFYHVKFSI